MSQQLINHSSDLKRLQEDGYEVSIKSGYLVITSVPYVNSSKEIKYGTLVSDLSLAGDMTDQPANHVAMFIGEYPCNRNGVEIVKFNAGSTPQTLAEGLVINHSFSTKPKTGRYTDYHEKMTTYIAIISGSAEALDPKVTARTYPVIEAQEEDSVFNYIDNASSRAGINIVTQKLEVDKIGIIGLGGTGSYVLDFVAKTPVKEIYLFDGDRFSQHNAFRSPGAPSVNELREKPQKVTYFKNRYSSMRRNIVANDWYIDSSNVDQLREMDFIFLCIDSGSAKKLIVEKLKEFGISFIDVGMGIYLVDEALGGIVRTTIATAEKGDHVEGKISFSDDSEDNEYTQNIQIADLNALNASLAVIKWKKLRGFYLDFENEHHSLYTIDGNNLINEVKL